MKSVMFDLANLSFLGLDSLFKACLLESWAFLHSD